MRETAPAKIPYRHLAVMAALGALVAVVFVLTDLSATSDKFGGLIGQSPTDRHLLLPWDEIGSSPDAISGAHDGRYYYAIARSFPDIHESAAYMDRPAYRTGRILFPALAKLLHPIGIGSGLIWTMFAIGVAGVFLIGFASGVIASLLGGVRAWVAAVPGIFYGSWVSLRITVPDPLAYGLALAAVALAMAGRHRWAIAVAIMAVLTRETTVLLLVGYALWRRDRKSVAMVVAPTVTYGAWALYLKFQNFPIKGGTEIDGITAPLWGWYESVFKFWARGYEPLGWISLVPTVALALVALRKRGIHHPVAWMLIGQLVLLSVATVDVLGPERNASRVALPILALAVIALVTPAPPEQPRVGWRRGASSRDDPERAPGATDPNLAA